MTGPLSGNWQISLLQQYPLPLTPRSASGFLSQSDTDLSGSIQTPAVGNNSNCGGVSALAGTLSGQNVTFSLNEGGTSVNFTGTISLDNKSMSGDYQAVGGGCFNYGTTGTFNAFQIPPLTGNFTGTLDSQYMELLQGGTNAVPVPVSGSFTQGDNAGASNATVTGTITAVGYPCFTTVSLTGTISGQNVYMDVYNYNGDFVGTFGAPAATPSAAGNPVTLVVVPSGGVSLVASGGGLSGLYLGINTGNGSVQGPCPALGPSNQTNDAAGVDFVFQ